MKIRRSIEARRVWTIAAGWAFAGVCLGFGLGCGPGTPSPESPAGTAAADFGEESAPASSKSVDQGIEAIKAEEFARAKELLAKARADNPQDPQAPFYLGVAEQELGNNAQAIEAYREALRLDPRLTDASLNLSALLLDGGTPEDASEALRVVEAALQHAPQSAELTTNRAVALGASGDFPAAAKAYGQLVAKSPEDAKLRLEYARLLSLAGDKSKALQALAKVKTSDDPVLLTAAANLHGQLGDYRGCLATLDRVIQKEPAPEPLVRRGACKKELGDKAGARDDYEKAIELDDKYAYAYLYLGWHLYFEMKRNKAALDALQKAQELGEGTPVASKAAQTIATIRRGKK
ncbi:tetratricopeptide repeat protein [Myxococcota bacterium]